jgi:hypothetical protein
MSDVYSYHTFLFPFLWDEKGVVSITEFEAIFKASDYWTATNWAYDQIPKNDEINDKTDARLAYNAYQYFNPPARRAIYGLGSGTVSNYKFIPKNEQEKFVYYIKKNSREFRLDVNAVRIKIYNTGVAVMIIETENTEHRSMSDVKLINQFGRRISAPFLPADDGYFMCADEIGMEFDGDRLPTDFRKDLMKNVSRENIREKLSLTYVASTLKELMTYKTKYSVTSDKRKKTDEKSFFITPVIDDRMFVVCLIRDDSLVPGFRDYAQLPEIYKFEGYRYQTDFEKAKELYSFCFVDDTFPSCQNREMIQKLFGSHLYARWIEVGTIHAVTHHSMMCITGTDLENSVVNPFLKQYAEMAVLAIVQRASIISFELLASKITDDLEKPGEAINRNKVGEFLNLQERFLAFQNQILFFEVTPQEQGVEIYNMLLDSLYINSEKNTLDGQMQNLYEAATVSQGFTFNRYAAVFAAAALIFTLGQLILKSPEIELCSARITMGVLMAVTAGVSFAVWLLFKRGKK